MYNENSMHPKTEPWWKPYISTDREYLRVPTLTN